ncbi:MAG: hypothetical protein CVT98_01155 [Bacteroidetes bacterium HGW-Bacteroidetes-15]|nr:MAG: hypothetical protein CVT98_01155 [Bacteroidetes bacterium HGW-Bacteroidetes-15]
MKFIRTLAFLIAILCFTNFHSYAQTTINQEVITSIYYYSFSGELSTTTLSEIETEVKTLTNVDEVKVKYKEENKLGQLIVIVKEKSRSSEGDILFQPTDLKRILSKNGLNPNALNKELLAN